MGLSILHTFFVLFNGICKFLKSYPLGLFCPKYSRKNHSLLALENYKKACLITSNHSNHVKMNSLQSKFTLLQSNFFPPKFPFANKIQMKILAGKKFTLQINEVVMEIVPKLANNPRSQNPRYFLDKSHSIMINVIGKFYSNCARYFKHCQNSSQNFILTLILIPFWNEYFSKLENHMNAIVMNKKNFIILHTIILAMHLKITMNLI